MIFVWCILPCSLSTDHTSKYPFNNPTVTAWSSTIYYKPDYGYMYQLELVIFITRTNAAMIYTYLTGEFFGVMKEIFNSIKMHGM